ncbi:MAG: UDP-N-acetyl-D-mannosamine dehydrogenase [Alphaproteobacteria bacterium]|nr:UDP-N-acetyl-D-mannosamine dehydrogenase [Alphaproteobacteria bacterium]
MAQFRKIEVVGLGYIGLPTAAVFADQGVDVVGVDTKADIVDKVNQGKAHFGEPNLDALVRRVVETKKLRASLKHEDADAYMIAVPTPLSAGHRADITYVEAAAAAIAPCLKAGDLVVLESTSPVGTTEKISAIMAGLRPDLSFPHQKGELSDIRVAHCPERVLPGRILEEVVNNPRIIGGMTRKCAQLALSLYQIVVKGECHVTNARTAELSKLTENAFRDVNIAFANELSFICDKFGINVWELIRLANLHPRVNVLRPGPGVGGHCIAVDPWFIVDGAPDDAKLIRASREINDSKPDFVVNKVKKRASELRQPVIACLGLAYKADVDDLRESPAVEVVKKLGQSNLGKILVVEPHVNKLPHELESPNLELADFEVAVKSANLIVLLVAHRAFMHVDRDMLKDKFVIDTVGAW